jgi:hypothetical protein
VILGLYAEKSHNLIGQGIVHGDKKVEISMKNPKTNQSNYEIFPHKILKSHTFKKSSILIFNNIYAS